jgi:hypothetical protein
MTEKHALQEILEGLTDVFSLKVRSYSGRGMYGRNCLSVVTDRHSPHSMELALHLGRAATDSGRFDEVEEAISGTQEDSMGLGSVIYWPRVPYVEDDEEKDDD